MSLSLIFPTRKCKAAGLTYICGRHVLCTKVQYHQRQLVDSSSPTYKKHAPKILPLRAENNSDLFAVTPHLRAVRLTCKVVLWVGWTWTIDPLPWVVFDCSAKRKGEVDFSTPPRTNSANAELDLSGFHICQSLLKRRSVDLISLATLNGLIS